MNVKDLIREYSKLYSIFEKALEVGDLLLGVKDDEVCKYVDERHRLLNKSRELTLKCVDMRLAWEKTNPSLSEKAIVSEYRQRIKDLTKDFEAQNQKQILVLSKKTSVLKNELSAGNKKALVARAYTGVSLGGFTRAAYRPAV